MKRIDWRVFISYRGDSVGEFSTKSLSERLYVYLTGDPVYKEKYGEVYYSPKTGGVYGNFERDIPSIMRMVEFFIMPLNKAYFSDFWDEGNNCPDENSITYKEIQAAMTTGCRFICIAMPGFNVNQELMRNLFADNASIISCAMMLVYNPSKETELFRRIGDAIVQEDFGMISTGDIIRQDLPNVFLSFKGQMESSNRYPFYRRLHDVKRMTLINFASSVFISGIRIASIYEEGDYLKRWFDYHLIRGDIEVDIVLTNPHSMAARDAAKYKMRPSGQKVPTSQIIITNLNKLYRFMRSNPDAKVNLYLTDIALPFGLMITEHKNPANNHMKVDIYAAAIVDDQRRPSFYMLQSESATAELYSFFVGNAQSIMRNYSYAWHGHPDVKWIKHKHIIHRAMLGPGFLPHTKRSVDACISAGFPMEIDLLELADGQIIIGRADQEIAAYGIKNQLSDCTATDIRKINRKSGEEKILFLREFLQLVGGRVPLLLEIKTRDRNKLTRRSEEFVKRVMVEIERYLDRFIPRRIDSWDQSCHVAIHSTSPYVLKLVRDIDCMISVGLISMDFSRVGEGIDEEFIRMHNEGTYLDIIEPDFLAYDIRDIENGVARRVCEKKQIPLVTWTIRSEDDQQKAQDYCCDSIIIEGARSYLY